MAVYRLFGFGTDKCDNPVRAELDLFPLSEVSSFLACILTHPAPHNLNAILLDVGTKLRTTQCTDPGVSPTFCGSCSSKKHDNKNTCCRVCTEKTGKRCGKRCTVRPRQQRFIMKSMNTSNLVMLLHACIVRPAKKFRCVHDIIYPGTD